MNEYYNVNQLYDKLVQTATMTTLLAVFMAVYDHNEINKSVNTSSSNNSHSRPTIEAILLPKEKWIVNSYDVPDKKGSDIKRITNSNGFTKKYHDRYSKVNTKTNYNRYLNSRY